MDRQKKQNHARRQGRRNAKPGGVRNGGEKSIQRKVEDGRSWWAVRTVAGGRACTDEKGCQYNLKKKKKKKTKRNATKDTRRLRV